MANKVFDNTYTLTLKDGNKFALSSTLFHNWLKANGEEISHEVLGRLEQLQRYCTTQYIGKSTFEPHQIADWELN